MSADFRAQRPSKQAKPLSPPSGSDSSLSDVEELPSETRPSLDASASPETPEDDLINGMATSELDDEDDEDDEDDAAGEEDADFDEETAPPQSANGMRHDIASSDGSPRPSKRKLVVDDEEYMKQNPELYGLRRSVCLTRSCQKNHAADTHPPRAAHSPVVEWLVNYADQHGPVPGLMHLLGR